MKFLISEKEGISYSKFSGEYNKIHLDNLTGYNSIFGEKICHGCYVIIKFLKYFDLKKQIEHVVIESLSRQGGGVHPQAAGNIRV